MLEPRPLSPPRPLLRPSKQVLQLVHAPPLSPRARPAPPTPPHHQPQPQPAPSSAAGRIRPAQLTPDLQLRATPLARFTTFSWENIPAVSVQPSPRTPRVFSWEDLTDAQPSPRTSSSSGWRSSEMRRVSNFSPRPKSRATLARADARGKRAQREHASPSSAPLLLSGSGSMMAAHPATWNLASGTLIGRTSTLNVQTPPALRFDRELRGGGLYAGLF